MVAAALLLASAACRVVPAVPRQYLATNNTTLIKVTGTPHIDRDLVVFGGDSPPPKRPRPDLPESPTPEEPHDPDTRPAKRPKPNPPESPTPEEPDQPDVLSKSELESFVCRGEKLTRACQLDQDKAAAFMVPINTNFRGSLKTERKLWGYNDEDEADCDIDGETYDINRAYGELNILAEDTSCHLTLHYDHESELAEKDQTYKVGDKVYRVSDWSDAFTRIH